MVEIHREAEPIERKVPGERRQVVGEPLAGALKHRLRALFVWTTLLRACNLQWIGDLQPECPTRTQRTLSGLGSYFHNEVMIVDSRTQATQQWNSLRVESAAEGPPGPLSGTLQEACAEVLAITSGRSSILRDLAAGPPSMADAPCHHQPASDMRSAHQNGPG